MSLAKRGRERGSGGCGTRSSKSDNEGKLITALTVVEISSVEEKFSHEYFLH